MNDISALSRMKAFSELISKNLFFADSERLRNPSIIIIAGQPGSGKSVLIEKLLHHRGLSENYLSLDPEKFKSTHPLSSLTRQEGSIAFPICTARDARIWIDKLEHEGLSRGVNLIAHSTLENPDDTIQGFTKLRTHNHKVILKVLLVRPEFSEQSIVERNEQARLDGGHATMVSRTSHEKCFYDLRESLDAIETYRLADVITLQRRDGSIVYENELVNGTWIRPMGVKRAVLDERLRPMSFEEMKDQCSRVTRIVKLMSASGNADDTRFSKMIALQRKVCLPDPLPTLFLSPFRAPFPMREETHPFPGSGAVTFGRSML